jgi:hypothetical protein
VALMGYGLEAVAAMGLLGELASLAYVTLRMDAEARGLSRIFARRALFLLPAGLAAGIALSVTSGAAGVTLAHAVALTLVLGAIAVVAVVTMPEMRSRVQHMLRA